jgi:hypothetical protein
MKHAFLLGFFAFMALFAVSAILRKARESTPLEAPMIVIL